MFASAAIIDAVRKDERRKDLDDKLERARQDLNDLRANGASEACASTNTSAILSQGQMDVLWNSLKDIYLNRPYMKEIHNPAMVTASELMDSLRHDYYRSPSPSTLKSNRQTDYAKLERAITLEQDDYPVLPFEAQTRRHLAKDTAAVEKLIGQLLDRVRFMSDSKAPAPSYDEARALYNERSPQYIFSSINRSEAGANSQRLNERLRSITDSSTLNLREKVGRVCYNLLVSAHPPDMHTYNTLIVAFDKCGSHALSEALVHSFFFDRLLKPTPSTYVAILNHYRNTNNHGQFLRALACLTGVDSVTGGKIRRRANADIVESPVLHSWASDTTRRTMTGNWVYEHVPLHQHLVEEVIRGLLHFQLFDQAASFFVSCLSSGVQISARVMRQVLDDCVYALDWRGAIRLVQGFSQHQKRLRALLADDSEESSAYVVDRLYMLLDVCGLTPGQPSTRNVCKTLRISEQKFGSLVNTLYGLSMSPSTMLDGQVLGRPLQIDSSKSRLLQLESLWKEYVAIRKTTASIESKLLNPSFSSQIRSSMALHIGADAAARAEQLIDDSLALLQRDDAHAGSCGVPARDNNTEQKFSSPSTKSTKASVSKPTVLAKEARPASQYRGSAAKKTLLAWERSSHSVSYSEANQWAMGA